MFWQAGSTNVATFTPLDDAGTPITPSTVEAEVGNATFENGEVVLTLEPEDVPTSLLGTILSVGVVWTYNNSTQRTVIKGEVIEVEPRHATYDPTTTAGVVRMNIGDTNVAHALFSDDEITAFLAANYEHPLLAAAAALDVMATNEAYIQKRMTILDIQTDGVSVAASLRESAKALREQAANEVVVEVGEMWLTPSNVATALLRKAEDVT